MSMTYNPATGRLTASDDTIVGFPNVFDTNDGLLFVDPADVFTGSVSIPARTATSQGVDGVQTVVDVQQDYLIGIPSSPGSRYVRGMIRTTASASGEMMDAVWRQASGTHLDAMDGVSITTVPQSDLSGFERLATLRGLTFFVNELGHLVLRERSVARARDRGSPPASNNRVLQASTVSYRLLVGSFFGADFTAYPGVRYAGFARDGTTASSYSLTPALGYEYTGRRVYALIGCLRVPAGGSAPAATAVTIGGVAATIHGSIGGVRLGSLTLCSAVVPTGTSATVGITLAGTANGCSVYTFTVNNFGNSAPTIVTENGAASSGSISINVGAAQAGIVMVCGLQTSNAFALARWGAPAVEFADENMPYRDIGFNAAAIARGAGSVSAPFSFNGTTSYAAMSAVWS